MSTIWWMCTLSLFTLIYKPNTKVYAVTLCSPPCLLVSNTTDILAVDHKTAAVRSIISGLTRAVAIDVHFSLGYIFWSDVQEQNIKRFHIDLASTTTIITGIGVCDGLAVDWRSLQLYWTDTTSDTISISDLNGNNQRTLINLGLDEPRAIALDLDSSLMFWTDWGSSEKIEKASLSGNQRVAIVTTSLFYPNGIELDRGNKRIFWVDAGYDRVESVDYNGNNRKQLFQLSGLHPFDVTLIPPFLFFTDWNTNKEVHNLDATTGEVIRSYSINGGQPMGIVAYDYARQPPASSPCAQNNGGCSHFCVAKASGHECVCPTGLTVKQDGKTCDDKPKTFILFTDADDKSTNYISLDVNYFISRTLFNHLGNQRPIALDYDPVKDRVYWSDIAHGRIFSALFNATSLRTLFHCNVQHPDGIAIDHVGRNIYWTDTGTNRIEVARLDGTSRKLLFKDGLDEPRAIVLDDRNGMMYWTDWGVNPKIEQAEMDGSARRAIVTENLGWPNGLAIDQASNRLFWADAALDKIEVSNLNGGNRQLVLSSAANIHPYGLEVYQNVLYWTDWNDQSISRYNLSSKNKDMIVTGLQRPMDILVFDPSLIFSGPHNCSQNNGLCSDFCLLKPGGYQCACPTGVALKPDGKTCDYYMFHKTSSEKFMIFAEAYVAKIYKVPLAVPGTPCLPLGIDTNISRPVAVDYDPVDGKIYWTDVTLKLVARAFPNGSSVEVIAYNNVDTPDGLAVDYIDRNIYWTDKGTSKIEVARLDGSFRRSLITSNIKSPRAILLDIEEREMYWSDWGSFPKIEKLNMDGSARTTLVSSGLMWVNSLALDYQYRLLYWCDASHDKIERVDLQGNNRVVILDLSVGNMHPFGLALSGDALYWSDWNDQSIYEYNMTTSINEGLVHGIGTPMEVHIYDQSKVFSVNRCAQLSAPVHGNLDPCPTLPGQTCQFFCDRGYNLTGSTTRTCNSDGTWTGTQPQCNAVTCPVLQTPPNGNLQGCTGTTTENYNTVCLFSCNPGFNELGSPSRKCLENGTWSGQDFHCQGVKCRPLNTPPSAILLTPSCGNTYGSNCVFACQSGYGSTVGNVTRTCLQTGQWSGNSIICTDILPPIFGATCPASPLIVYVERGLFSAQVNWTEPVATDNSGFPPAVTSNYHPPKILGQGSHVITYTAVDQSGNQATCSFTIQVIVINCTRLTVHPGGPLRMSSCGNHYGAQCNFSCSIGHRLNGSSTVRCVAPGNKPPGFWDNHLPSCPVVTCVHLSIPPRATLLNPSCGNTYGSNCVFGCQSGYGSTNGNVTRTCLQTGQWSGNSINCTDILPPTFGATCPSDPLIVYAERGLFSAQVNWTEPVATDNSGVPPAVTSSYQPRQRLDRGTYVIVYTSVDQSENKATCSFVIEVTVINCTTLVVDPGEKLLMSSCGNHYGAQCNFSCTTGYRLNGSSTATCVAPGNRPPGHWDNPLPSCQAITCPALPTPSYGFRQSCSGNTIADFSYDHRSLQQFYHNTVCLFSCYSGFNGYGSSSRKCQEDGTWSGKDFVCLAHSCGPANIPANAILLNASCGNLYGAVCTFGCQSGYVSADGNVTRTCLHSGQWSGNPINCTDTLPPTFGATCPASPLILYAERGLLSAQVNWNEPVATDNSGVSPTVTSNYQPLQRLNQGNHVIIYTAVDQSGNNATCSFTVTVTVINCTSLSVNPGGPLRMSSCGNHYGAECNFSCTIGHRLNGSSTVTCVAPGNRPPGTWNNPLPTCQANTCPALPTPSNGIRQSCTGTTIEYYDTVCLFSCNVGFYARGSYLRKCQENGIWSGRDFHCQAVGCVPLGIPPRAILLNPSCGDTYGSNCVFGCQSGYSSADGNVTRTCLSSEQWSGNPIYCTDNTPPSFNNTCPNNMVFYAPECSTSALVTWNEPVATDTSGHVWLIYPAIRPPVNLSIGLYNVLYLAIDSSVNQANCTFIVQVAKKSCPALQPPVHGSITSLSCGNSFGSQASFSCDTGYRMNGSSQGACEADGTWSGNSTICNAIRCPSLPIPTNGFKNNCVNVVSEPYDTQCSFSCNVGYNLTGSPVRRCLENGTWSGEPSYCQVVTCPTLLIPKNGVKADCTSMVFEPYGTQCTFACNGGYNLIGPSTRRCLENGTWSLEMPFCQAALCSPPCLLVSNTTDILAVDHKTSAVRSIISGLTRAVAIDVHFSLGYIFWSDVTERNIKRFHIDLARTKTIIAGIGVCDGLAVDWRSSKLYWTDTTYENISVSDLNGNNRRTLINLGLDEPRGIALDLDSGFMFWTDWGANPKIERASLSGSQRLAIVTANLYWPNGIELDKGNKRIFWVDATYMHDKVESVDYKGNNRKLLYQQQWLHPFDVAFIPPFLFFTDWVAKVEVHQLDASTGKVLRSYGINGGQPMGIVAYDSSRQPPAPSPCAVNNGGCSHFCVVKTSGYECVCSTGLAVKQDGKTCEEEVKKFILFVDADDKSTNYISLDVEYFVVQTLFNHLGNQRPIALDFDPVENRVYWSDVAQGVILSAFSNATSVKILFRCNVQTPEGLAIDHVGRNIYWTDTGTNRIEVARLDGTSRKLLFADGLDEPRAIVLDERNGMMYWTDWGANPKIEQAQMDGSARRAIVTGNLGWPNGLTIDQPANRLFWADAKLDKIEVSDLNGGNRQLIFSSAANIHAFGLAVYKNMLYWTDWNRKSISRNNLTSGHLDMIVTGLQQPMDIHVFDPSLIFSGPHNCSQNNGLCSDLCLLKPGGYQCACPTGVTLKSDGKNCDYGMFHKTSSEKFMIFAEADMGEIYKVPLAVPETPCLPLGINTIISRPVAVDYDPVEGKIYWTDVTLKLIARAFPNGSSVEVIAQSNVTTPNGLTVDSVGRLLYWTDSGTSKIEVARLDGSFRKRLITSSIDQPRAIILDIPDGKMYWSDWGSFPKIEQANIDGSSRTTLVSSRLIWVTSLALDYQNRLLYWCDAKLDKIERVDLQGNNRVLILDLSSQQTHPFGLALAGDILYWSDWNSQSVLKFNMSAAQIEVLVHGMGRPMELHIYDQAKVLNVNCPKLIAPANGSLQSCSNLPGKSCHFSCNKGYNLTGSPTRTCNNNATWTGTQPQCNAVTCPALQAPSNGKRQNCSGKTAENYNIVCRFSCNAGFDDFGSPSRRCLENGSWSGQDFLCQAVICSHLDIPPKAILLNSSCGNTYGSNCVFGCQSGYDSTVGNVTRTCLQTGQWSGNPINCTVNCPLGYFFNISGCQPCGEDHYQDQKARTSCIPCPSGTSTFGQVASKEREDCRTNCPLGYFFNTTGCQACTEDHYQDQEAQTSCVSCPSGTSTFGHVASKRREDCRANCPLGYFFNTTGCQACAEDHYKDQEAQTSCVSCPSGTSTFGHVASKRREDCRVNCTFGYFFNTTGCQACAEDHYQDQKAQTSCVRCPFGTSTFGHVASKGREDCRANCTFGYFFNNTGCQACAEDHYQDQEAQTSCVSCPSGTSTFGHVASKRREDCRGYEIEQSRAEQSRTEQSRAEQSRAEQSRAEQSRAEQSRAEQSRAEQSRAEQSRAEQSRAEQIFISHSG
ncbi:hypothetical protein ACROYT_G033860 [Oculina patagonica]